MTTQEAYEQIRAYFTQPDAVLARTPNGQCRYRTDDGAKCAVGCLIPDELYHRDLEGAGLDTMMLRGRNAEVAEQTVLAHLAITSLHDELYLFLLAAQQRHDSRATSVAEFIDLLDDLAAEHKLDVVTKTDEGENQ